VCVALVGGTGVRCGDQKEQLVIMTMTCEGAFALHMRTWGGHDGVMMDVLLPMTMTSP
jgi:hypothetical protein